MSSADQVSGPGGSTDPPASKDEAERVPDLSVGDDSTVSVSRRCIGCGSMGYLGRDVEGMHVCDIFVTYEIEKVPAQLAPYSRLVSEPDPWKIGKRVWEIGWGRSVPYTECRCAFDWFMIAFLCVFIGTQTATC